jgi:hypothetical protein
MDDNDPKIVKVMEVKQLPCMCGYHKCRYCGENAGPGCMPLAYCPHCGCPQEEPVESATEEIKKEV